MHATVGALINRIGFGAASWQNYDYTKRNLRIVSVTTADGQNPALPIIRNIP